MKYVIGFFFKLQKRKVRLTSVKSYFLNRDMAQTEYYRDNLTSSGQTLIFATSGLMRIISIDLWYRHNTESQATICSFGWWGVLCMNLCWFLMSSTWWLAASPDSMFILSFSLATSGLALRQWGRLIGWGAELAAVCRPLGEDPSDDVG